MLKLPSISILLALSRAHLGMAFAADASQDVTISDTVQIPGAKLKAGTYQFSVEDRLADRAIVRITSSDDNKHYLLLTVPNAKLGGSNSGGSVLYFTLKEDKAQALRAWVCPGCAAPLEFVYPKLDAVKITDASTEPVMAVDPEYDKLPANLTADDMKVVTLWLLAPERITADNVGKGVKAAKYVPDSNQPVAVANPAPVAAPAPAPAVTAPPAPTTPSATDSAATAPASPAVQSPSVAVGSQSVASADTAPHRSRLPKTASNTYLYLLGGLLSLVSAWILRAKRMRS